MGRKCFDAMKTSQVIRIAMLLVVIFAAGLATGRMTAPKPRAQVLHAGGRVVTSDGVLARLTAQLELDADQQRQFAPVLEELAGKFALYPPATPERLQEFRLAVPRMAALVHPPQKAAFDRYVRDTEAKMDRMIRNRTRRGGGITSGSELPAPATNR